MDTGTNVVEITAQSFQTDVIEKSRDVPVVILFWAEQVEAAADMKSLCERIVESYQGKLLLALSDVAAEPIVAQQLRVQNIPSVRVIQDGKLLEQLDGPQGERPLRQLFDQLTMSSNEALQQNLEEVIAREDWSTAMRILQDAINTEPNNPLFKVEAADVMVLQGDLDGARKMLDTIAEDVAEKQRPQTRLEFVEEARGMGVLSEVTSQVEANSEDLDLRYSLAVLQVKDRDYEGALRNSLAILQSDRTFRDDLGRKTMVRILNLLGKSDPLTQQYRRRMFAYMH